jgi:phosphoglucosamine mutase
MSNIGLELSLREHGIQMVRAKVGDRYVVESMRQGGFNLGGEQSGHIIFLDQSTTGDGIVAALKVLEVMRRTGKPLSELKKKIKLYPQVREDVRISRKEPIENMPDVAKAIADATAALKDRGRVFVRFSGTEPLCRVMLEGEDTQLIRDHAKKIASTIQRQLG